MSKAKKVTTPLTGTDRELFALQEWFTCSTRSVGGDPIVVEVRLPHDNSLTRVEVLGVRRCTGGIAVVTYVESAHGWNNYPEHLDDLLARWAKDRNREYREAAKELSRLRDVALGRYERSPVTGECDPMRHLSPSELADIRSTAEVGDDCSDNPYGV